jgi:nucleoid-associated protein
MGQASAATGGYALFVRYSSQGADWLLIVMLKLRTSTGIDESNLELTDSVSFDIDNLHEAARIDLDKWRRNDQPYLSFVKRRSQQDEVTRYFRLALGCTEYTDSKSNTDRALKAVDAYCAQQEWNPAQKREARRKTYDHFEAKKEAREPVNLVAFSAILNDQAPDSFLEYVRENDIRVSQTFEPHRRTYSRFRRISQSFGTVKISFDVQDVQDEKVDYQETANAIIIRDVPDTLALKIRRAKGDDIPDGPA